MNETIIDPWASEVSVAQISDLNHVWAKWTQPGGLQLSIDHYKKHGIDITPVEVKLMLGQALNARKDELERTNDSQPGPDPSRRQSTYDRVEDAIAQHLAATDAYAAAVEDSARKDAEAKRLAARKFLLVKADVPEGQKRVTDVEANKAVDADQEVLEARLASDIAAAQAKAAKARLDHWERVIAFGISVYSRESRADTR